MSAAGRFGAANSLSSAVPGAATLMHSRRPRTAASGRLQWLRRYNHNLTTIRGPHARGPRKLLLDSEGSVRLLSPAKVLSPASRRRFVKGSSDCKSRYCKSRISAGAGGPPACPALAAASPAAEVHQEAASAGLLLPLRTLAIHQRASETLLNRPPAEGGELGPGPTAPVRVHPGTGTGGLLESWISWIDWRFVVRRHSWILGALGTTFARRKAGSAGDSRFHGLLV